jgi:hypothetical protein
VPTVAATTPTVASADVISIFSDAYTNVGVTTFRTSWSNAGSQVTVDIDGNPTLKYNGLNFAGIDIANPINASSMETFHIDMWTPDCTTFKVKLVDFGADGAYAGGDDKNHEISFTPSQNGWNSYDIALSDFTGLTTKSHIAQLVLSASGGIAYVDNMYFSRDTSTSHAPVLGAFAVATKAVGADSFTLTVPDSPSSGAFTYTSSNEAVATIDGNTVTIVGAGTTDITATQAASGNYLTSSKTASFIVTAVQLVAPSLPLDFEASNVDFAFGNFAGGVLTKISNPQSSGINTSANVAQMVKNPGEVYGGSTLLLGAPIDFSANKLFKVKVYSPRAGATLLLKVENSGNAGINFERSATTTVANAWEELSFNYSAISTSNQYDKLVFIFDLGTQGDGSANYTFLMDDIHLETAPVVVQPLTITTTICGATPSSVKLTGPWWGWDPNGGPSAVNNGNGTWTFTIDPAPSANMEYLLVKDGVQENLVASNTASGSWSCTPITDYYSYANRQWTVGSGNVSNIYGTCSTCPQAPTEAAPTPIARNAWDVKSIFSGAYPDSVSPVNTWLTPWSAASFLATQIAGNDTQRYTNLDFAGIETPFGNGSLNASAMEMVHLDYWTPNISTFKLKLVDFGAD